MSKEPFPISAVQRDRAVGALLATAAGDAVGAGYIGGTYVPGEWTDATAMAIAVAEIVSITGHLTAPQRLEDVAARWAWWARNAKGIGPQTGTVLAAITDNGAAVIDVRGRAS